MKVLAVLVAASACLACAVSAAAETDVDEAVTSGSVTGELLYHFDEQTTDFTKRFTQMEVRITRGTTVLLDEQLQPLCQGCMVWPAGGGSPKTRSINVQDLDRDGEPEVLVDLYTGGAHCCEYTLIYRFDGTAYTRFAHSWGNPGYRLRDLNHDGRPEFVTGDDRFNYAFSCYACSAVPILIERYRAPGRLVNVTRAFRAQIRADATRTWGFYRQALRQHGTPAGVLPAYVADEYMLGKGKAGWARVRAVVARPDWPKLVGQDDPRWRNRARYLAAVHRFLVKTGYVR